LTEIPERHSKALIKVRDKDYAAVFKPNMNESEPQDNSSTAVSDFAPGSQEALVICAPVFNDWDSVKELLARIDNVAGAKRIMIKVVLVNDGSTEIAPSHIQAPHLESIDILNLKTNIGHQRAIGIGLTYIYENYRFPAVIVMDADGEDKPEDIPELIARYEKSGGTKAVFAKRSKRTTGLVFKSSYHLYKIVHRVFAGFRVEVGNFSIIPFQYVHRLVVAPDLWNHYAAAVFKSRIPFDKIPLDRGHRIAGKSSMNFTSLVIHGLSAISVFSDRVGVRLLIASIAMIILTSLGLCSVVLAKLFTGMAIPGWASVIAGGLFIILLQALTMSLFFIFIALYSRNNMPFLPLRDYKYFILYVSRLGRKSQET
jgi:polyisoprenyl-phosphate glycosyltransferase